MLFNPTIRIKVYIEPIINKVFSPPKQLSVQSLSWFFFNFTLCVCVCDQLLISFLLHFSRKSENGFSFVTMDLDLNEKRIIRRKEKLYEVDIGLNWNFLFELSFEILIFFFCYSQFNWSMIIFVQHRFGGHQIAVSFFCKRIVHLCGDSSVLLRLCPLLLLLLHRLRQIKWIYSIEAIII